MHRIFAGTLIAFVATGALHAEERKREPAPVAITGTLPCPAYGPGFVMAPGSKTCVRLGGSAAVAIDAGGGRGTGGRTGMGARGQLELDTRTDTEQGPLRAYVRMRGAAGTSDFDRR